MRKIYSFLLVTLLLCGALYAQNPITMRSVATYNAAFDRSLPDSVIKKLPYYGSLGVRRVIVADANNDGKQEIIATDYADGGRVHVLAPVNDSTLEVIWSSPAIATTPAASSTPRFPQVGDCDGDGNPEIIFERGTDGKIVFYEWNPAANTWGYDPTGTPDFYIDNTTLKAVGALNDLKLNRETLLVKDIDGDGKSEIICHTTGFDVYVLSVENEFPGFFAQLKMEGGDPATTCNGRNWATGSYYNTVAADINGDGKLELINHHWDNYAFWSITVNGKDSYTYPDTNNAKRKNIYCRYNPWDGVSYFGVTAADVNGDGRSEIVGTKYTSSKKSDYFDVALMSFTKADTGVYIWNPDSASMSSRIGTIATNAQLAALGGKKSGEFWPIVKGDLNGDGKDELYTGAGTGINLIAIQYKGQGSLTDPNSYTENLVYTGAGGGVYATYEIYNGKVTPVINGTDTTYTVDKTVIDTVRSETPFTSYIFADNVDLNKNGKKEIVLSEQSVYDSITVNTYNWVDSTKQWAMDKAKTHKIFNPYRKTIRVLEYTGATSGLKDLDYSIVFPGDYKLEQNYPNPFNPTTNIRFTLPLEKKISLKIYDMLGKEVCTLVNDQLYKKGKYEMMWNGKTNGGQNAASGNYIARLVFGNYSQSIKMTLLK